MCRSNGEASLCWRPRASKGGCCASALPNISPLPCPSVLRLSRAEAAGLDPQARLLLERTWGAVADARLPPSALPATGVYVGCVWSEYQARQWRWQLSFWLLLCPAGCTR